MLRNKKIYVSRDEKLKVEVIWLYHDMLVREHGEQQKIIKLVTRNFWQLEITKKVKKYIEGCDVYQRNKNCTETPIGKLMPNIVLEKAQAHIIVDFITKLLLAQESNSILVVYNRLTKIAHFVPTIEKTLYHKQPLTDL